MSLLDVLCPVVVPKPKNARRVRGLVSKPENDTSAYNRNYYQDNKDRILAKAKATRESKKNGK